LFRTDICERNDKSWLHTDINDKLDDLETRDIFLPPDSDASRTLEVVPIHENVNHEIQSNHDPGNRCKTNQLGIAEEGSGTVVVTVEECFTGRQHMFLQTERRIAYSMASSLKPGRQCRSTRCIW
jgi:hypothetical protein